MSKGQLQHDLWGVQPPSDRWDWGALRADIAAHGVRNSLLVAPMPTASTSQARSIPRRTPSDALLTCVLAHSRSLQPASSPCLSGPTWWWS